MSQLDSQIRRVQRRLWLSRLMHAFFFCLSIAAGSFAARAGNALAGFASVGMGRSSDDHWRIQFFICWTPLLRVPAISSSALRF